MAVVSIYYDPVPLVSTDDALQINRISHVYARQYICHCVVLLLYYRKNVTPTLTNL